MPSSSPRHRPSKGKAGTLSAYRKGCRCKACSAANARKSRDQRARQRGEDGAPIVHIFGGVHPGVRDDHVTGDTPTPPADGPWGDMETAVRADLNALEKLDVPAGKTLQASALTLARELDNLDSRASKAPLVKQLVDVMSGLTKKEAGTDDPLGFLSGLSDEFPAPTLWDESEPEPPDAR